MAVFIPITTEVFFKKLLVHIRMLLGTTYQVKQQLLFHKKQATIIMFKKERKKLNGQRSFIIRLKASFESRNQVISRKKKKTSIF